MGTVDYQGYSNQILEVARRAPYLSREEEFELATKWHDNKDAKALERLTLAHLRLVLAQAMKFRSFGLPLADMAQEGQIGLMEAAARFDPSREVRFSTYATWWIKASIQDYILRNWSIVRGGTSSVQKRLFFSVRRLHLEIARQHPEMNDTEIKSEIATKLNVKKSDVERMSSHLSAPDASLNAPISESDGTSAEKIDLLEDTGPLPDDIASDAIDMDRKRNWLADAMKSLNQRELMILKKRRLADEAMTLEALGEVMGISKERVRQIESAALKKLRSSLEEKGPGLIPVQ
ncbi:RNA polymerase factor sigma-32 [Pseudovibrio exalbescens]|uniref:RNA polymerase factor sigma-32 n=1 Tax=Pseudovibrio exalbescens TaxID=197461 RepID=UPI002366C814|nr:RNA polymerase factor sigma-32 [Pseudovibrio exalbescens]MDD7911761.1 RNA polymerase factor sigma-32 [Pseudovibrio exalbescens]